MNDEFAQRRAGTETPVAVGQGCFSGAPKQNAGFAKNVSQQEDALPHKIITHGDRTNVLQIDFFFVE